MKNLLLASTIVAAGMLPLSIASAQQNSTKTPPPAASSTIDKSTMDKKDMAAPKAGKRDWDSARVLTDAEVEKLADRDVINLRGENVGEVHDIVVGPDEKATAVLEVGGFLGLGEKLVAIPLSELRVDNLSDDEDVLLLSQLSEDELKEMPAYDEGAYRPYKAVN